jgi:hypothetical protein
MKGLLLFIVLSFAFDTKDPLWLVISKTKEYHTNLFEKRQDALAWINKEFAKNPEGFVSLRPVGTPENIQTREIGVVETTYETIYE